MNEKSHNFLHGTRAYLSGPMDFVADRATEKRAGWRVRVKAYLQSLGVNVFDPWEKPSVRGMHEYGREDLQTIQHRDSWTFEQSEQGSMARADLAEYFWSTMHIDLRMVDLSDFVIAYCPSNVYSVGTVHEIVIARQQHKPVLMVSPPVGHPAWEKLQQAGGDTPEWSELLSEVERELPVKKNVSGTPSLWYMPLLGSESFFDGFGFCDTRFHETFPDWREPSPLDRHELERAPERPLLPFLAQLAEGRDVPRKWDHINQCYRDDDDWLLLEEALK
ncbi:MAG: hypothetical protein WD397_11715 [Wenzhouxiangellaceae bacterium]